MSVYNAQDYLRESIESVLNQTHQNIEFIIINDGSTDSSLDIITDYLKMDERIVLIDQGNMGLTKALNVGIRNTSGDYIARQDADDVSYPNRLEKFIDYLNVNGQVDFYSTPAFVINESSERKKIIPNYFRRNGFNKEMLNYHNSMIHGTLIIGSEIAKKNLYNKDYRYSQDFELYHRLFSNGLVLSYDVNNISYGLRLHGKSITSKNFQEHLRLFESVFRDNHLRIFKPNFVNKIIFRILDFVYFLKKYLLKSAVK